MFIKTVSLIWIGLLFLGCGDRALQVETEDSGVMDVGPSSSKCPYPDGVCNFDSDCPGDQRCDGAMHTTSIPHAFVCRGVCVPREKQPLRDAGSSTDACVPPPGPAVGVTLEARNTPLYEVFALLHNNGCTPIYYLEGCCGEGDPAIEVSDEQGSWISPHCTPLPRACCNALPKCQVLAPGEEVKISVPGLTTCACGSGRFRVRTFYYAEESCATYDLFPTDLSVESTTLDLGCDD